MKRVTLGLALSLATAAVAAAQPAPSQPQPQPAPRDPAAPPTTSGPEAPPPVPGPVPEVPMRQEPADTGRPAELAFGIGIGYVFPTSLETPNTTSVRLRLPSGLTFEPQVVFSTSSTDTDTGTSTTSKQNEVTVGSLARYPFLVHNKVDFELLGSAAISHLTNDPDGADNTQTTTTVAIGYGIGLAYWLTSHWNFSLTAANPLISYSRTHQEMAAGLATTNKTTTVGVVFDPTVTLMIHLYN